jgi:predicted lysophospholipase L1 biosynthesis ABC-type transport system permease subunit
MSWASEANAKRLIVSELLARRLFPNGNAVGQRIDTVYTTDGVAANVKNAGLAGQDIPEYYTLRTRGDTGSLDNGSSWNRHYLFLISSQVPASAIAAAIETRIAAIDPMTPVTIQPLDGMVYRLADRPRFEAALLSFFALTGIVMAIVGLYGLTSYLTAQRTQEIGIRIALGAGRASILCMIAWQGARLILLGCFIGAAASIAATQALSSVLYGVSPRDPLSLAAAILLLTFTALAATLIPARRAIRIDPVDALRCE